MAATGRPKVGGRVKGTPNKATMQQAEDIRRSGLTPLQYMIGVMRDEDKTTDVRLDAAKAAAPYVHPKLASIEVKGDPDAPIEVHHTVDAFTSRIARIATRAAADEGDREPDA